MIRLTAATLLISLNSSWAAAVILIDEDFSDGVVGPTPVAATWSNTSGGPEVAAGTAFATARAVATTYDHDNNGGTPNVNIPGGLEVNVSAVSTQTITVAMPLSFDPSPDNYAQLTFWSAVRANNATGSSVSILNITDGVTVLAPVTPSFGTPNTNWQYNSFTFPMQASYAGDQFRVTFVGGGSNGANGLELTDIDFFIANVPEPTTSAVFLAGAGLTLLRRRRQPAH